MSAPQSHKGIILVADDNEANRELLSALLGAEGYQVVCAADGQQALARVNNDSIDLALLDCGDAPPNRIRNLSRDEVQDGNPLDSCHIAHQFEQ